MNSKKETFPVMGGSLLLYPHHLVFFSRPWHVVAPQVQRDRRGRSRGAAPKWRRGAARKSTGRPGTKKWIDMDVSSNGGTPIWMVYNGKYH